MNNYTATQYILLPIRLRSTIMQIYKYTNIGIHRIYECANIRIHRIYEYTNPEHKEYTYTQTQNIQKIQIRKHTNTQNILIHKPKIHRKYETYKYTEYTNTQTQNTHCSTYLFCISLSGIVLHLVCKCCKVARMSHVLVCTAFHCIAVRKCCSLAVMPLVNAAFHCRNVAHCIALQ